ncbi:HlyD family type I secretion periplasmic adaptor subunit [Solimonas sp. K1W22B-7]|uniref:HlyD family type I secretion periplasmic adaptor subunit n=1 Tax=Solimonas sp. K1W22B-7 TaxID=2303331 RepID=UPI000E332C5C|nr:HlyD family type I secretion periplasmic adaptor subunit [Solimonas sp. K1W22B-7]AXQ31559.1 HlyD family type I secretion periplasmic adaptor subunit [Solimonas sp. K1W22B-7]
MMLPRPKPQLLPRAGETDYVAQGQLALIRQAPGWSRYLLWGVAALMLTGLAWAAWAEVDEVTHGEAQVIPSSQVQVIQSLEGGIVSEMKVRQGDVVQAGQTLARIDDTRFSSSVDETQAKLMGLSAAVARLEAEVAGAGRVSFPENIRKARPDLIASEQNLFDSRARELSQAVGGLDSSLQLARREYDMAAPLVREGVMSQMDEIRMKRDIGELQAKISERRNAYRSAASAELSKNQAELAIYRGTLRGAADRVSRTELKSPVRGVVKQIAVNTVGGVVAPGAEIMQIVPLDDTLLVEAKLRPQDIAFIRPGQQATVKITAYDYGIFGGLDGKVEMISADSIVDERDQRRESYFHVRVRTDRSYLGTEAKPLPIIPGMTAQVDVLTGRKTILHYLLKPINKARERALRER